MNIDLNIENFIKDFQTNCQRTQTKKFIKGETITTYIEKRNQLCLLISGSADLVRYDLNGHKTIIEHFSKNSIFGETFYNVTTNNELSVETKTKCEVLFYSYNNMYSKCKNSCKFHSILADTLPKLILNKVTDLNMRIELLTQRSTRDKLIGYFSLLSVKSLSKTIYLTFSLTDLADYLSVDRSAMMREIKLLIDDGIIKKEGNKITLLSD